MAGAPVSVDRYAVLFNGQGPTGGATLRSSAYAQRGDYNAVIVEVIPTPDVNGNAQCDVQVVDSYDATDGYQNAIDTQGTMSGLTAYTKRLVTNVHPFIKAAISVSSGNWRVIVSPGPATSQLTVTSQNQVDLDKLNGVAPALTNPLAVELSDGTSEIGTPGNPLHVSVGTGALEVGGVDATGGAVTANPVQVGGVDVSSKAQPLAIDANGNLLTSLGTGLDNQDDALASNAAALYPAQGVATISSSVATVTVPLGNLTLAGPSLFDAKHVALYVENTSGQTINALQLEFSDAIGSTATTQAYPLPSVSLPTASVGAFLVPLTAGKLKTAKLLVTFAANASTGAVKVQAVFSAQPLVDLPFDYRVTNNAVGITVNTPTVILAAPASGLRLYLLGVTVTNSSATGTIVTIQDSSTTIIDSGYVAQNGGWRAQYGERGIPLAAGAALSAQCTTAGASVTVAAQARLGV